MTPNPFADVPRDVLAAANDRLEAVGLRIRLLLWGVALADGPAPEPTAKCAGVYRIADADEWVHTGQGDTWAECIERALAQVFG